MDPARLLARDAGELAKRSMSATMHGSGRVWARWTWKREGYLRVVGEIERRRDFGDLLTVLHGGDEQLDLYKSPENEQRVA